MCGRYTLTTSQEHIEAELGIFIREYEPSYNIAPTQKVVTVVGTQEGWRGGHLQWGLVPSWAKDTKIGAKMINARSETLDEKPSFKKLLTRRRCLIVADSFYEWKRTSNGKTPYRIAVTSGLFTFAGLWDRWSDGEEEVTTCTIITCSPNRFMEDIHDRMPVILEEQSRSMWLDRTVTDKALLKSLLTPLPSHKMSAYEVSKSVNNPRNNDPTVIKAV